MPLRLPHLQVNKIYNCLIHDFNVLFCVFLGKPLGRGALA